MLTMVETLTRTEYIEEITLDERSILKRSPEVEHERAVALTDLQHKNSFTPHCMFGGPYNVSLSVQDNRLHMQIESKADGLVKKVELPLSPFRRIIKDYFLICESYYDAIKQGLSPHQVETIDMARRGIHNEGSDLLKDVLETKIALDFDTARRLFTLICVLHIK